MPKARIIVDSAIECYMCNIRNMGTNTLVSTSEADDILQKIRSNDLIVKFKQREIINLSNETLYIFDIEESNFRTYKVR